MNECKAETANTYNRKHHSDITISHIVLFQVSAAIPAPNSLGPLEHGIQGNKFKEIGQPMASNSKFTYQETI